MAHVQKKIKFGKTLFLFGPGPGATDHSWPTHQTTTNWASLSLRSAHSPGAQLPCSCAAHRQPRLPYTARLHRLCDLPVTGPPPPPPCHTPHCPRLFSSSLPRAYTPPPPFPHFLPPHQLKAAHDSHCLLPPPPSSTLEHSDAYPSIPRRHLSAPQRSEPPPLTQS
jgi:hypothetical protein